MGYRLIGADRLAFNSYKDPFEDYKTRLAKKLARRAEAEAEAQQPNKDKKAGKEGDDVNWFGVKVGTGSGAATTPVVGGGVGKYLNASKRTLEQSSESPPELVVPNTKRKKRFGFGSDFEGW